MKIISKKSIFLSLCSAQTSIRSFLLNHKGGAAIEFAILAPFLIFFYFSTIEVCQLINVSRNLNRMNGAIADLISQETDLDQKKLHLIINSSRLFLESYNRTSPSIIISGIDINKQNKGSAISEDWSYNWPTTKTAALKHSGINIPDNLKETEHFLIRVEIFLNYTPLIAQSAGEGGSQSLMGFKPNLKLNTITYIRPRYTAKLKCNDCNIRLKISSTHLRLTFSSLA